MGFVKAVLLFLALILSGALSLVIAIFTVIFWPKGRYKLNRIFLQMFGFVSRKIVGMKFVILNEARMYSVRPAVLIGNHQSGLDLAIIGAVTPFETVIVAKKSLQHIPVFGWFFKMAGNILIDRSKTNDAKRMINEVTATIRQKNLNLAIFPEGTRNRHGEGDELMLPFKKGAFFLASSTKLPIIPVVCSSLKGKAVWESFDLKGGTIVISVLEPIATADLKANELDGFRDRVRTLMMEELKRINQLAEDYESKKVAEPCAGCH